MCKLKIAGTLSAAQVSVHKRPGGSFVDLFKWKTQKWKTNWSPVRSDQVISVLRKSSDKKQKQGRGQRSRRSQKVCKSLPLRYSVHPSALVHLSIWRGGRARGRGHVKRPSWRQIPCFETRKTVVIKERGTHWRSSLSARAHCRPWPKQFDLQLMGSLLLL